jgi:hypothetical protein
MCFYFVNCDDLQHVVMSRGIAGKWVGGDDYKRFWAENGANLSWFITSSIVLAGGENWETLTAELPELIPWDDATPEVGQLIEELGTVKQENARLKARLCLF